MSYDNEEAKKKLRAAIEGQTPPVPKQPEIDPEDEKRNAAAWTLYRKVQSTYRESGHEVYEDGPRAVIRNRAGQSLWIQVDPILGLGYGIRGHHTTAHRAFLHYNPSKDVFFVPDFPEKNVITHIIDDLQNLFT